MSNLRDQLKKAKLLSEKRARQLAHEQRVHRKEVGREGLEQEERKRAAEIERLRAAERDKGREAQEALDTARREAAERAACLELLQKEAVLPRRGQMRWYFQLDDGSLPWLEIDQATAFELQSGNLWVMRKGPPGSHVYGLLPAEQAARVQRALPGSAAWAPGGVPA